MSQTTSGAGGAAAAGWYTDPHDPRQLRWWSGDAWTEHVSAAGAEPQAAQPTQVAQAPAAAPAFTQPQQAPQQQYQQPQATAAPEVVHGADSAAPVGVAPVGAGPVGAGPVGAAPVGAAPVGAQDALPSRRALREPATDGGQQAYAVPSAAVPSAAVPSAATANPAFPSAQLQEPSVQQAQRPQTFLEKQGYPAVPDHNSWDQPAQSAPAVAATPAQPVQAPAYSLPPEQNAWNQPAVQAPAQQIPDQQNQGWGQPAQQAQGWEQPQQQSAPADGIDALFGGGQTQAFPAPTGYAPGQQTGGGPWGLTPSGRSAETGSRTRNAQSEESGSRTRSAQIEGSSTFWAWVIAISPLLAAGSIGYGLKLFGSTTLSWQLEAVVAAPFILVILFAIADRSGLISLGYEHPASWTWAVLSAPIYLLLRGSAIRRDFRGGSGPLVLWFVSLVLAAVGIVAYGLLTKDALYPGLPVGI